MKTVVDVFTEVMEHQILQGLICHCKEFSFYWVKYEPQLSFGQKVTWSDLNFKGITVSFILNRMQRNKGKSKKIS